MRLKAFIASFFKEFKNMYLIIRKLYFKKIIKFFICSNLNILYLSIM